MKKYLDIDVIAFLEEQMKRNTQHHQEDFEIDKRVFSRAAASERPEDKTLLWLSRPHGTQLVKEHDAFIKDTVDHCTWRFYAEQTHDPIAAFAVELTGSKEGVLMGNVYELDFRSHAQEVAKSAVAPLKIEEKTFEDGFVYPVRLEQDSYLLSSLVEQHGKVMDSLAQPKEKDTLADVMADQKASRKSLQPGVYVAPLRPLSLDAQTAYNAVKEKHPDAIVCFAQHGHYEIYGEDAKKAAPILGSKVLVKELEGCGKVPVTGFQEGMWAAKAKKLWSMGNDVLLTRTGEDGKQETVKDLKGADFIPVGMVLPMEDRTFRIDAVNYPADTVTLTDLTDPQKSLEVLETVGFVRSYVEDAEKLSFMNPQKTEKGEPRSVLSKLRECKAASEKAAAPKHDMKPKSKGREI